MVTAHLAHFNDCCTGGCQGPCQGGCQGGYNGGAGGELVYIRSCQPQRHATKYHTRHVRTRYRHRGYSSHQTVNVRVSKHDSGNVCTEDCDKERRCSWDNKQTWWQDVQEDSKEDCRGSWQTQDHNHDYSQGMLPPWGGDFRSQRLWWWCLHSVWGQRVLLRVYLKKEVFYESQGYWEGRKYLSW